jgi:NADP-dependent 3-hydroxy acid dehydrogenase YdfG
MPAPQTVVITGASKGIGAALARRCVAEGLRVALIARTPAPLSALAASLGSLASAHPCDIASPDAVAAVARDVTTHFGGAPDVLVNNAGLFQLSRVEDTAPADFAAVIQTNLIAPFLLSRAFLPAMRTRGRGCIITLGSIADRSVFPENGAYAASKYGLRAMHDAMRQELRGSGVRATLVSPGPVDTPLWDPLDPDSRPGFTPRSAMLAADDVADAIWYAMSRPAHVSIDELRLSRS